VLDAANAHRVRYSGMEPHRLLRGALASVAAQYA
jgi:hypothetical protein